LRDSLYVDAFQRTGSLIDFALLDQAIRQSVRGSAGQAQASSLTLPFQLNIGGVPAPVTFAGIVGGSIGLYQFNVSIPVVAPGDQTIELVVDGVSNNQNLYITIGQ
jgi:uncharacterized protein (TIGR03437 family)